MPKDNWDKAGIVGQILSGVLLAAIALLIKTGADNISTSLKKGELVQSLISDLAAESDKNIRQDVALIALNHSLGDQEQDLIVEIAEQIVKEGEYEKVAGSVAYKILEQRAPARAKAIHDQALLVASNPSVRQDLRSSANPAALTASPTPIPAGPGADSGKQFIAKVLPNLVLIQFRDEQSRSTAEALSKELRDNDLIAPGVDHVEGEYTSSIRFFHEEDRALAERVAGITKKFFSSRNINVNPVIQSLSKSRQTGQPGQIEIWIDF